MVYLLVLRSNEAQDALTYWYVWNPNSKLCSRSFGLPAQICYFQVNLS